MLHVVGSEEGQSFWQQLVNHDGQSFSTIKKVIFFLLITKTVLISTTYLVELKLCLVGALSSHVFTRALNEIVSLLKCSMEV